MYKYVENVARRY